MIVDAHTHFWFKGFIPAAFHRYSAEAWAQKAAGRSPEMILPKIEDGITDPDGTDFIENMDKAGVDASIVMMTDFGVFWTGEEPPISYEDQVARYAQLQHQNPGRLYACAFADPRRKNSIKMVKKAVKEHGLKGCGEFTTRDLVVNGRESAALAALCVDLDIPLVIHTRAGEGIDLEGADYSVANHNHPVHLGKLAQTHKDLKIVIAHAGYPKWWSAAIEVARDFPNCYLELSNWNFGALDLDDVIPILSSMRDFVGAERILFASDHPSGRRYRALNFLKGWVDYFKALPERAKTFGYDFTEDEVGLMLGGNAKRLFNL